jgi:hypothetical protein
MNLVITAHLVPGRGIKGDRFYGHFGNTDASGDDIYDVTLVEQEAIQSLLRENRLLILEPARVAISWCMVVRCKS